tara:strand:+ start:21762 stop:22961 length:1200 start_codon:yes stop_codon:yes gene_type:complete
MAKKIYDIYGIKLGSASSNTRYGKREDSLVVTVSSEAQLSGKFTSNKLKAAPVTEAIQNLSANEKGSKVLLINAGNANAANGPKGIKDVKKYCKEIASDLNLNHKNIIPFSTGVIGQALPVSNYLKAFREALTVLDSGGWKKAANAILTTDTKPKIVSKEVKVGKKSFLVTGFAKGSGMIRPDFATLLSFVFVDAKLSQSLLNKIHTEALKVSFEAITVDGDTSPNDSSMLIANGNKEKVVRAGSLDERRLTKSIIETFKELAELLVKDAEGATKLIKVKISKAKNPEQARSVAFTVAESPLVKTAMFGSDANWGRILSAIGRDKTVESLDKLQIKLNGLPLVRKGFVDSRYSEKASSDAMKKKRITIEIVIGTGNDKFEVLTSDLSEDYVLINSDYRS